MSLKISIFEKSLKALEEKKIDKFVFPLSAIREKLDEIESKEETFLFIADLFDDQLIIVRNIGVSREVYRILQEILKERVGWCFITLSLNKKKIEELKKQYPNLHFEKQGENTVFVKKK